MSAGSSLATLQAIVNSPGTCGVELCPEMLSQCDTSMLPSSPTWEASLLQRGQTVRRMLFPQGQAGQELDKLVTSIPGPQVVICPQRGWGPVQKTYLGKVKMNLEWRQISQAHLKKYLFNHSLIFKKHDCVPDSLIGEWCAEIKDTAPPVSTHPVRQKVSPNPGRCVRCHNLCKELWKQEREPLKPAGVKGGPGGIEMGGVATGNTGFLWEETLLPVLGRG